MAQFGASALAQGLGRQLLVGIGQHHAVDLRET